MGLRIRSLVSLAMVLLAIGLLGVTAVLAAVTTDQADYAPGSVVTISGDNSDGAGYLPGETVHVDVSGPNGYTASCEAVADENGAWSCQVTLWDSELAVGEYTYTATGQTSGVSQSGTFTDAININSFASDCSTASESFASGTTVCAKATGLPGGGGGSSGKIEWWAPSASSATRTTTFSGVSGNFTDSFAPTLCGTWTLKVYAPSATFQDGDTFEVTGCAPANTAPTVAFSSPPTTANEGDTKMFNFDITDAASDTHTFVTGFPDCGSEGTLVTSSESINNTTHTGTFQCLFPDGLDLAVDSTVRVRVQDQGPLTSNIATTDVTVSNVAPTVVAGFTAVSVNCQTTATLTIDPDDVGVNDSPWKVNIDWGDGNTEPEISRTNLNSFTVTHVYALAGVYNATVSVTDKDNATGSDNTNGITVNQTYTVDFLPPFDDSTPSGLIINKMKNGRVVPVKATIYDDCAQAYVTDPTTSVTIKVTKTSGSGSGDPIEEYADAGQSSAGTNQFRWTSDVSAAGGGFWIYNLDSKALGLIVNNLYRVDAYVGAVKATVANWAVVQPVK